MNAQEIKQGRWNTNTVMPNGMYGSLPSGTMDNFVLPDRILVWSPFQNSCLPRRPPQKSAEPDITWFTKPVFSSSHYSYLRLKMTWSNLQMDVDQICRHIVTPQCVKWGFKERTQWTFNPDSPKIVLVGSLGESCNDFTQGWRSKHLQDKAKTNNFKNCHWRQYLFVCLYEQNLLCAAKLGHWQTQSNICDEHTKWWCSQKHNHKYSLGNMSPFSISLSELCRSQSLVHR